MKALGLIVIIGLLSACTGRKSDALTDEIDSAQRADSIKWAAQKKAFKPYKLNPDYTVLDTGEIYCGTWGGNYAIVKYNTTTADTIHLNVGMQEISPGCYMFLKMVKPNREIDDKKTFSWRLFVCPRNYVIVSNGEKRLLKNLVSGFEDHKSEPNVVNGKVYFWQYSKQPDGNFKISAAEYNVQTASVKSQYLFTDDLVGEEHFIPPHEENTDIVFQWVDKFWTFSPEFKLIKQGEYSEGS